ncbi:MULTISPECIES: hypothetical protein [Halomonadaceae]|uniref:hypothetical protein n=1 Tax=Halomonadaceae TaxID=28256 RepID=UPI000696240C|nr:MULTISPECIES: hypothetical protein [Halomonas]SDI41687.1 hypothetical protein SAMN04487867_10652 [Halomonas titanicae]
MERTLFVFEGEKVEPNYFNSLAKVFFSGEESNILVCFQNDIYELYKAIVKDEDLDPFEIIKELNSVAKKQESLAGLRRDQISQIYLFFDMEPCDNLYSDEKLCKMLELFDNETENGKLFISYPMVEALRDIDKHEDYLALTVDVSRCKGKIYKGLSSQRGNPKYRDAKKIDKLLWQGLVDVNMRKANGIVSGKYGITTRVSQPSIASTQINNYLPNGEVAVLSAFPIFLADYFGQKVYEL